MSSQTATFASAPPTSGLTFAQQLAGTYHTPLFGRGEQYLIALEDPLKLKEISYIHAKADPSGELKHGSLALVGEDMPVVAVATNNELLGKLKKTSK